MTEREYRMSLMNAPPLSRARLLVAMCAFWIIAAVIGFATQVFAATPAGLRGSSNEAQPKQARRATPTRSPVRAAPLTPQAWLGASVWRAGPCDSAQNFQTFTFSPTAPKVEVGAGKPGEGERLELLRISAVEGDLIQVETRVCAPVGCNQTVERYKKIDANTMQEWHFEGRLPDHAPYVIVANGAAVDGSGPGRVFNRCGA